MLAALNTSAALELEGLDDLETLTAEVELEGLNDLDETSGTLTPEDFLTYALTHRVLHSEEWAADRAAWQA
jgi:hypothetical protein